MTTPDSSAAEALASEATTTETLATGTSAEAALSTEATIRRRGPSAWRHLGFRQLTRAWLATNLADSALFLMVAVWVKDMTGSDAQAALVFVALGLPALAAPFLGQLADRMSRKKLLVVANVLVAGVVATLFAVSSPAQLWLVYSVMVAYGAVAYLTVAAQSGLIRDLLPDEDLASGNGLLTTIDQGFRLVSPLVGAGIYAAVGPGAVVALTVVCFLLTAVLLTRVQVVESPPAPAAEAGRYWHEITAGFVHLFRTQPLGRLTLVIAAAVGAAGLINVAVFPAMEQGLGVPTAMLGAFVAVQGVGSVVGGLTAATIIARWGETRAVVLGMLLLAIGCLPVAGSSLPLLIAGLVLAGFGVPVAIVAFVSLRQRLTPPQLQGRTSAASNLAFNLPSTLTTLLAAAIIGAVDYRILVYATAVGVVASLGLAVTRRRSPART